MSYVPGTKLSYGNDPLTDSVLDTATVLTDGAVMVTMLDGSHWREIMKLADWLVLGEGKVTVVYSPPTSAPVPSVPSVPVAPVAPVAPVPVPVPAPSVPVAPVIVEAVDYPYTNIVERTKFKWVLDQENYCVAVQTQKGVLQVKSINQCPCRDISCGESYDKILFKSHYEWIKSLPNEGAGGKVTITAP